MTTETETVADVLAEMREWANGDGCFDDDPDGKPMLCVYWAKTPHLAILDRIAAAHAREVAAMQAKIDALMLEYCPDEMTQEQVKTWGKSQRVAKLRDDVLCVRCNKPTMHMGNVCYTCSHIPVRCLTD